MKTNKPNAFTLVEILISTVIIASVLTTGFYAITFITIGKIRLVEATKIEKEGFYFSEKLFEMIKSGGELDFEEYFNRKVVGNSIFSAGHYTTPSGYGNFGFAGVPESISLPINYGSSIYYCRSPVGTSMGIDGCIDANNSAGENHDTQPQRYGQYAAQFIDYNSDFDNDTAQCGSGPLGDEDCNGEFIGDDDDIFLGQGPDVFVVNDNIHELYLISGDKQTRTYFRWNVVEDPNKPPTELCDLATDPSNPVGDGCLGTVEFLVLDGRDWGNDHDEGSVDGNGSQYDGTIDTWIVNSRFAGNDDTIAGAQANSYWESLFPDDISVSEFEIYAFPHKDINLAWKESNSSINQAPYVRLKLTLSPSWNKRKIIKGTIPKVEIATTISLSDEFSQ